MSQVPPPVAPPSPPSSGPVGYGPPPKKTNGLAIGSLIAGLVGFCVPFVGGLVAIVLGILGIKKANDPQVGGGKGMAIAGLIIGVLSVAGWGMFFGGIFGVVAATSAPGRAVANDWMVAASAGDIEKAASLSHPAFPREDIQTIADHVKPLGAFQDMTSNNINLNNNVLNLQGTATFANGKRGYKIVVTDMGGGNWKLQSINIE